MKGYKKMNTMFNLKGRVRESDKKVDRKDGYDDETAALDIY